MASSHRATACAPGSGCVSWLGWTLLALPARASIVMVDSAPDLAACVGGNKMNRETPTLVVYLFIKDVVLWIV